MKDISTTTKYRSATVTTCEFASLETLHSALSIATDTLLDMAVNKELDRNREYTALMRTLEEAREDVSDWIHEEVEEVRPNRAALLSRLSR